MATQFIRRERGPTPPPAISHGYRAAKRYAVVVKEILGADRPTFKATAYRVGYCGEREAVVNDNGRPLVAVGTSAVKATSYLMAALRRRSPSPANHRAISHKA